MPPPTTVELAHSDAPWPAMARCDAAVPPGASVYRAARDKKGLIKKSNFK